MTEIVRKTSDFVLINPDTIHIDIDPEIPVSNKYYEPSKPYWLYALKLENGKYYVGFTGKANPYDRIIEHTSGDGAKWTKRHKPVAVLEIRDAGEITLSQVKALEINLTWAYMMKYGLNNVRGGRFNSPERMLRVGRNSVLPGYAVETIACALLLMIAGMYILLRHYFNWW